MLGVVYDANEYFVLDDMHCTWTKKQLLSGKRYNKRCFDPLCRNRNNQRLLSIIQIATSEYVIK